MRQVGHFIGGKVVQGTSGRQSDVFDPNTGEVQAKVALASKSEVEAAIANAEAAQPGWAASALAIAASTSFLLASATLACTSPVLGSNTSPWRPDVPWTTLPPMK